MAVKPIPEGFHTVTPYLAVRGAAQAIDFYRRAFGAEEVVRMPMPGGDKVMHAELRIGDSRLMLADEFPEMGGEKSPAALGGSGVTIHLYVDDVDATFARAVGAGATAKAPPADMFCGDRFGKLEDPFGHVWSIATHKADPTPEQMAEGMKQAFAAGQP
jgi:PhnB protein